MQAIPEDAVQEDSGDEEDDPNKRISSKIISQFLPHLLCISSQAVVVVENQLQHVLMHISLLINVQSVLTTKG